LDFEGEKRKALPTEHLPLLAFVGAVNGINGESPEVIEWMVD